MSDDVDKISANAVKDGSIRELYLSKVPVLKTIDNWKSVELVGWIDHKFKLSHYEGGLVKLNNSLYFVKEATIKALQEYMDWKFPLTIKVIPEKDSKAKPKQKEKPQVI
jgi:hypothetical protein